MVALQVRARKPASVQQLHKAIASAAYGRGAAYRGECPECLWKLRERVRNTNASLMGLDLPKTIVKEVFEQIGVHHVPFSSGDRAHL